MEEKWKCLAVSIKEFLHDVRTPLTSIELNITAVKNFLPILVTAYTKAVLESLVEEDIPSKKIVLLKEALSQLSASIDLIDTKVTHLQNTYIQLMCSENDQGEVNV